jgi:hypothetical protein
MAPAKRGESPEIRALLREYVGAVKSVPPLPNTSDLEARLAEALVMKFESLDRTRHDLAKQLGTSIRDSGTFEPLGQAQLDLMMLRAENTKLKEETADLKVLIKTWTDRKNDWVLRVVFAALAAAAVFIWQIVTSVKK